jgi:hypothetical protein
MLGNEASSSLLAGAMPGGRMRAVAPSALAAKIPADLPIMMCGDQPVKSMLFVECCPKEEG